MGAAREQKKGGAGLEGGGRDGRGGEGRGKGGRAASVTGAGEGGGACRGTSTNTLSGGGCGSAGLSRSLGGGAPSSGGRPKQNIESPSSKAVSAPARGSRMSGASASPPVMDAHDEAKSAATCAPTRSALSPVCSAAMAAQRICSCSRYGRKRLGSRCTPAHAMHAGTHSLVPYRSGKSSTCRYSRSAVPPAKAKAVTKLVMGCGLGDGVTPCGKQKRASSPGSFLSG